MESQLTASQIALGQAREDQELLRTQLTNVRQKHEAGTDQLEQLQQDNESLRNQAPEGVDEAALHAITAERDQLFSQVEELQLSASNASSEDGNSERANDLERRLQMSLDDLKELKAENQKLQQDLSNQSTAADDSADDGVMDWEATKRKMLAQLEADCDEGNFEDAERKLSVKDAISKTDQALKSKDEEIGELNEAIESMRAAGVGNNEGVAMGAHAIGSLLDQDELIAHERDNLKQLQEEWKDKLRKAEVELSVERAKIARERADMQGQLKQLEQAKDKE
ncbi:MAG: hypothetical protein ACKVH8_21935, partial [Pirellulales bacterium]